MISRPFLGLVFLTLFLSVSACGADAQDKKKEKDPNEGKMGKSVGTLTEKSEKFIEVKADGEEKARVVGRSHGEEARALIGHVALIELASPVLVRALELFPVPVRTLDALHLASIEFLRARGQTVELASFDERLLAAARALHIPLYEP